MKCLLLALGLALVCNMQAIDVPQTMKDMDIHKLAGTWHSMAMAASDPSTENALLKISVRSLKTTLQGNLEITVNQREGDRCIEKIVMAERTKNPAEFNVNNMDKVFLLSTDHDSYLLLCLERTVTPQQSLACQYLDRTMKAQDKVMEEFRRVLQTLSQPMPVFLDLSQGEEQCRI